MANIVRRTVAASLAALVASGCSHRADTPPAADSSLTAAAALATPPAAILPESLAARLRGTTVSAETALAGYTVRCYSVNPQYPLGVVVFDGARVVWSAGKRGDSTREMDVDEVARCPFRPGALQARGTVPPFGTDINRDGAPDFVTTVGDGMICDACVGLAIVSLSRPFRADGIAFVDSVAFRAVTGEAVPELVVTDVTMNDLGDAQVRPIAVFAWRQGRWGLAADRMRTPKPGEQALDDQAKRLLALDPNVQPYALRDAMAKLVAGGHEDDAGGLMRRVLPDSAQTEYWRVFRQAIAASSLRSLLKS